MRAVLQASQARPPPFPSAVDKGNQDTMIPAVGEALPVEGDFCYNTGVMSKLPQAPAAPCHDCRETFQALQACQERAEKFQSIFENSALGIFQSTLEGRFLSVNQAFARMFGYDSPEHVISSINDIGQQIYQRADQRREILDGYRSSQY